MPQKKQSKKTIGGTDYKILNDYDGRDKETNIQTDGKKNPKLSESEFIEISHAQDTQLASPTPTKPKSYFSSLFSWKKDNLSDGFVFIPGNTAKK